MTVVESRPTSPWNVRVLVDLQGDTAVCHLAGGVESLHADDLRGLLMELGGHPKVVLDLAGVRFVDAAGLRVLVCCIRQMRDRGSSVLARGARPPVEQALRAAGFDRIVDLEGGRRPHRTRRLRPLGRSGHPSAQ